MTVYVDDMFAEHRVRGRRMLFSHMIADTSEELEAMADHIGVQRKWIQYPGTPKEHYDVVASKRALAIKAGAVPITLRQLAAMSWRRRVTGALGLPEDAEQWVRENSRSTTTGETTA